MKIPMSITPSQEERILNDMISYAGEKVTINIIKGHLYVYGSELACLRIAMRYKNRAQDLRVDYSENLNTWYFTID